MYCTIQEFDYLNYSGQSIQGNICTFYFNLGKFVTWWQVSTHWFRKWLQQPAEPNMRCSRWLGGFTATSNGTRMYIDIQVCGAAIFLALYRSWPLNSIKCWNSDGTTCPQMRQCQRWNVWWTVRRCSRTLCPVVRPIFRKWQNVCCRISHSIAPT